jgi:mono/diheme cytochrome c family protein
MGLIRWFRARFWAVAFFTTALWLSYPYLHDLLLDVEITAPERGYQVALRAGCFTCHGPDGIGGVKNPGNPDEDVPGFVEGLPMMWASSEAELREYVLDGAPARKRNDPKYRETMAGSLLVMPAYRGYLSDSEVDDLIAYIRARSSLIVPDDPLAARGQELAIQLGCFGCHGPMGARGPRNPGSLKGYIPGWWGDDFRDLVRSDEELRAWILDGSIDRLRENPIARHFIDSQRVYMPAYRNFIDDSQLAALIAYVRWVNEGQWQGKELDLGH